MEGEYTYAENDYPYTLRNVTLVTKERRTHSRMNQGPGEVNMAWQPTATTLVGAKAYYYDNDRQLPGMVRLYTNLNGENLRERNAFGQMTLRTQLARNWLLKGVAKYNWAESVYRDDLYAGGVKMRATGSGRPIPRRPCSMRLMIDGPSTIRRLCL